MSKYIVLSVLLILPALTSAHVTVRPSEVGIAAYQTFNVSVPTEKDIPTVGIRLVIPEGLESVRPNVKPGWDIEIVRTGEGEDARVTELIWTGGSVPTDQRDDFFFSARTPTAPETLIWKAYQTYSDGTVVAWDAAEEHDESGGDEDESESGPYSTTMVINDLGGVDSHTGETEQIDVTLATQPTAETDTNEDFWWDCLTLIALIMSGTALAITMPKPVPHNNRNITNL